MSYLEDLGCSGTALVKLLGGEVDLKVMDGFEVVLRDELVLVLANWKGLGVGGWGRSAERPDRFKQVMSTLKEFLAAFETFRHMLDFKFNMSCLVVG